MFYLKRKKKEADLDYLERVYSKTIKKETGSFLYLPLASIYYHKGNIEKAIETLQKGLSVHSSYVTAKYYLAFLYRENGEIDKAVKSFKEIAFSSRDHYGSHKALADYYIQNNDEKHAITELEELTRLTPYNSLLKNQINDLKQQLIDKPAFESIPPKKQKQKETEKYEKVPEKLTDDIIDDIREELTDDIIDDRREELTEAPIYEVKEEKVEKPPQASDKIVFSLESWLKNIDKIYDKV